MRLPRKPDHPGSAVEIAADLAGAPDAERRSARVRRREQVANLRRNARQAQAIVRLVDAFAKLGGGSLLTATLLLMVNGQVTLPVVVTAMSALLAFIGSTISLIYLDQHVAEFDHAADVIEAALKETER